MTLDVTVVVSTTAIGQKLPVSDFPKADVNWNDNSAVGPSTMANHPVAIAYCNVV